MSIHIIIGKNFGDEGKGLAVDYFASMAKSKDQSCLVIRHNGGAQAGHTVELPDQKRFVFHQLSSGSFRHADTFWAENFLPDLYQLSNELKSFEQMCNRKPKLYASGRCRCVTIDDVLMNMAVETMRGTKRHGSCGMGINEAVERSKHQEFRLPLAAVKGMSAQDLVIQLKRIRREYLPLRMAEYQKANYRMTDNRMADNQIGEYGELLKNDQVLYNAAETMCRFAQTVEIIEAGKVRDYDELIFEGAQGLLLDENYLQYAPYLTPSRTGAHYPMEFCKQYLADQARELVYVTRSYVTRHGAGPLAYEEEFDLLKERFNDQTNQPNEWQGTLRYALHGTIEEFIAPVLNDFIQYQDDEDTFGSGMMRSLMVTHLNETNHCIYSTTGKIPIDMWLALEDVKHTFDKTYLSASPYAEKMDLTS
ncbi:MAG: adenylosuccinate synthetase [Clostridia bacterium]|nr:adenylosuccinate synthetase [Clostridia bacterium]